MSENENPSLSNWVEDSFASALISFTYAMTAFSRTSRSGRAPEKTSFSSTQKARTPVPSSDLAFLLDLFFVDRFLVDVFIARFLVDFLVARFLVDFFDI